MRQVNIDKWSKGIGIYVNKYINSERDRQIAAKANDTEEYNRLSNICEEQKTNLINCINSIENTKLLPYQDEEEKNTSSTKI